LAAMRKRKRTSPRKTHSEAAWTSPNARPWAAFATYSAQQRRRTHSPERSPQVITSTQACHRTCKTACAPTATSPWRLGSPRRKRWGSSPCASTSSAPTTWLGQDIAKNATSPAWVP
jgi:hypothetical protein